MIKASKLALLMTSIGLLAANTALANKDGFYLSGTIGGAKTSYDDTYKLLLSDIDVDGDIETDVGLNLSAALGYQWKMLRFEAELGYSLNEMSSLKVPNQAYNQSGEVQTSIYMFNVIYDIQLCRNWTPYIGVGVGYMNVDLDGDDSERTAYQGMLGASYKIDDQLSATVDYRYSTAESASYTLLPNLEADVVQFHHSLNVGLRYSF